MLLSIDYSTDVPIYQQIRNQIVIGISNGELVPGEKLPTTRGLAEEIGINTMTVNKAYQLLKQEGYISADRRKGAVVNTILQKNQELSPRSKELLVTIISEARICGINEDSFINICKQIYKKGDMSE